MSVLFKTNKVDTVVCTNTNELSIQNKGKMEARTGKPIIATWQSGLKWKSHMVYPLIIVPQKVRTSKKNKKNLHGD